MWPFTSNNSVHARLAALELCRLPRLLDLSQARRVLVFAPHPDDESLGCGGTLARLARTADVKVVLVTDGAGAGGLTAGADKLRYQEFVHALGVLGIQDYAQMNYPDGAFEGSEEFDRRVGDILDDFRPEWVMLPSPLDYHRDHARISDRLEKCCHGRSGIQKMLFYEVWAPVAATHVVDITDELAIKRKAIREHKTALACADYEGAILGLNQYRGLYLGPSCYAEAFLVMDMPTDRWFFKTFQNLALDLMLDRMSHRN